MSNRDDQIPDQLQVMRFWKGYMLFMYLLHYVLGLAVVALSVTIASKPFKVAEGSNFYSLASWAMALVTGITVFVGPERIGERYNKAWRILCMEVTRFRADPSYTVNHVLKAYERAENIIHSKRGTE